MIHGSREIADWLSLRLGIPVHGDVQFEGKPVWFFTPQVFEGTPGYRVETRRYYVDSAKSRVVFGQYAGTTIEHWLTEDARMEEAFRFLESQPCGLSWKISAGERNVDTADALKALGGGKWRQSGLALSFTYRTADDDKGDPVGVSAFAALGFCLLLSGVYEQNETLEAGGEFEGREIEVKSKRYERSSKNRMLCLSAYGYKCQICGMDMGAFYGDFAEGAIEVHHVRPVSSFGGPTTVDPYRDLIPVCPNCHTALHQVDPPMKPDELRSRIESRRK